MKPFKLFHLCVALFVFVSACTDASKVESQPQAAATPESSAAPVAANPLTANFKAQLALTEAAIANANAEGDLIVKEAKALIALGSELVKEIALKQAECKEVLGVVVQNAEAMTALTVSQIEEQYHQGKALPKGSDLCYEAKEFVVHPATVVVLAREKGLGADSRSAMAGELGELANHVDAVEILLSQPTN